MILLITYLLNLFDLAMTTLWVKLYGIEAEANPIGRWLFENNMAWAVKIFAVGGLLALIGVLHTPTSKARSRGAYSACGVRLDCGIPRDNFSLSLYFLKEDVSMKKIMIVAVMLLCMAVCMVPVFAEEAELPSVPPEEAPLPEGSVDEPTVEEPSEEGGARWDMEEIKAYINGTVIPAAVMVVTALGALYVALVPVFNKIKLVVAKFNSASDEITATAGESRKTKEQTKATLDKLRGDYEQLHKDYDLMCARYETMAQSVSTDMTAMKQELSDKTARVVELSGKMEKMMVVAFCNNRELVEKGYARRIAQIGAGVEVDMSELVEATGEDKPSLEASGDEGEEADDEQDSIQKAS